MVKRLFVCSPRRNSDSSFPTITSTDSLAVHEIRMKMDYEQTPRKGSVVLYVPSPEFILQEEQRSKAGEQEASSRRGEASEVFHQQPLAIPFPRLTWCGIDHTEPFAHQVGGTRCLRQLPGKFMVAKPCSERELWFYACEAAKLEPLAPLYHGSKRMQDGKPAVLLQDLTSGLKCPCVLDIKMGVCTASPDRTPQKQASFAAKDKITTTGSIGARVCGLRVYQVKSGQFKMKNKHWGKSIQFGQFAPAIEKFFNNGLRIRRGLASKFLDKLQPILRMMEQKGGFRFYSSSILFIYEGWEGQRDGPEDEEGMTAEEAAVRGAQLDMAADVDVRMIDFAHVFPMAPDDRDESYLSGLRNLMAVLQGIADGEEPAAIRMLDHTHDAALHVRNLSDTEMALPPAFAQAAADVTS